MLILLFLIIVIIVIIFTLNQSQSQSSPLPSHITENDVYYAVNSPAISRTPIKNTQSPIGTQPPIGTQRPIGTPSVNPIQQTCVDLLNKFRKSQNLSQLVSAPQSDIDCANKASKYDAVNGYHSSFYGKQCPTARAQAQCQKGVRSQSLGGNTPLESCINAYIAEGPPGTVGEYPSQNHGHWNIITGNYTKVACGTDGNGFFTHNFS